MVGSTADMDRDRESISCEAWDLKNFKKNPVILPQHDYRQPAIGKATSVKVKDGQLTFKIQFPDEGINPVADIYRKLYKGGFMNASSVGFIPKKWEDGDGTKNSPFRTYTEVELLELSLVSVPANPNALAGEKGIQAAVKKGVLTGDDVKALIKYAEEAFKKEGEEDEQAKIDGNVFPVEKPEPEPVKEESTTPAADEQGDPLPDGNEELKTIIATLEGEIVKLQDEYAAIKADLEELKKAKTHYLDLPVEGESHTTPKADAKSIIEQARRAFNG
jgi:HK97 family phage prohead protease